MPPFLAVEEIHTYYGEAHILQGVSLRLEEGEVVTLIGRNGAGKTTTLRSVMGIARPTRGRVTLRGEDLTRRDTHEIARRGIAWVPEERRILPNLTVLENLRLGLLGRSGGAAAGALDEVFDYFPRLRERVEQRGRFLSGGEQQMLAIARGLVARPSVMLVDEPTEGLAPIIVEELLRALGTITRAGGICSIIVEQNAQKILGLADRVVILERGAIVHDAASHALKADPAVLERYLGVAGAAAH
jgi:branched-chain amino acid transport system ATP-binding protein